ncbi:MAG: hypothetical protein MUE31_11175 [Candidatus Nanopelagicales bacterium]|jgi:hypothetical protein|nr:hypothetical protein [Candidatus Nanopelagicales bacterium]
MINLRRWLLLPLAAVLVVAGAVPASADRSVPIRGFKVRDLAVQVGTSWQVSAVVGRTKGRLVLLQRGKSEYGKFTTVKRLRTGKRGRIEYTVPAPELGRWYWQLFVPATKRTYREISYPRRVDVTDLFPKTLSGAFAARFSTDRFVQQAIGNVVFTFDRESSDADKVVYRVASLGMAYSAVDYVLDDSCEYSGGGSLVDPVMAHNSLVISRSRADSGWTWSARIGLEGAPRAADLNFSRTCPLNGEPQTSGADYGWFGYTEGLGLMYLGDFEDAGVQEPVTQDLAALSGSRSFALDDIDRQWSLELTGSGLAPR